MDYGSKRRHYTTIQDEGARKVKAAKNILFLSILFSSGKLISLFLLDLILEAKLLISWGHMFCLRQTDRKFLWLSMTVFFIPMFRSPSSTFSIQWGLFSCKRMFLNVLTTVFITFEGIFNAFSLFLWLFRGLSFEKINKTTGFCV